MSKNNFKISCWIFVLFQIGWKINFAKGNYQSETTELATYFKFTENPSDKNNFLDKNEKVLKDSFSDLKIVTEKDYSKMAEILEYNLKKFVKEIEILKQSSDNDRETCVKNQNKVDTKLDEVLSEIEKASDAAKNCSHETSVLGEKENPDNTGKNYTFGVGKTVKFDIRMVCINPVTKLSTRPKDTLPTLFHTGKFFNYYDALKECENRNGVVFIPKTKEENDLWLSFVKNLYVTAKISEAFYPKTYYHEIKRFLWADCEEHSDFFKIKLPDAQFYQLAQGYVKSYSNTAGAICVKYSYGYFYSDHCEKSREGLAICERVLNN